ncbi:hypothetical protein E4U42_003458 [Claviceps africana]|uniref:Uncharacterized protein n=1 Tax=Claviceps africana TaxID=83212 RepID=A0A8K0J7B7_9HYPO|nr:hypothetical protein E4U42_003458 [Claviceps africana]
MTAAAEHDGRRDDKIEQEATRQWSDILELQQDKFVVCFLHMQCNLLVLLHLQQPPS